MGNTGSAHFDEQNDCDAWWSNSGRADPNPVDAEADAEAPSRRQFCDDGEFQLELTRIREKRRDIIGKKRKEMEDLRDEVARLKAENEELRRSKPVGTLDDENERLRRQNGELLEILDEKTKLLRESEAIIGKNRELRVSIAEMQRELQQLNTEVLNFEKEREDYRAHVVALKDVISVSKHMLQIRESQLNELKEKVDNIEKSLADREAQVLSEDLRKEYERQLGNIRNLRTLYEERQRMERREKADLMSKMEDTTKELEEEQKKTGELQERISELETDNSAKYDTIKLLESNLGLSKAESRQYQAELSVINQLFSEILLGFNSTQVIDLDKLQKHLEDHHDLLQNIVVNEISSEVSYALPKVLLDLLNQVNTTEAHKDAVPEEQEAASSIRQQMNSAEEIVENLPKVWRVLIELLSHQTAPTNTLSTAEDKEGHCYKTVDTPKGPSPVLSVSRTFIRLKDLILEKKSLEKETNHLKQLNGHLENRLQDQEKRLELVHSELSKTWLVVGTLQKQHQKLHTQEKILRYELAQKRKLLNELKEELEDSREKWAQAREKNSNTEQQWRQLRSEFASRKPVVLSEECNISGESGYSDDREGLSSDEEPGYETDISECAPVQNPPQGQRLSNVDEVSEIDESAQTSADDENAAISGSKEEENVNQDTEDDSAERAHVVQGVADCAQANERELSFAAISGSKEEENVNLDTEDGSAERAHVVQGVTDCAQANERELSFAAISGSKEEENVNLDTEDGSAERAHVVQGVTDCAQANERELSFDEVLARRDERLRRLEGQALQLVSRVTNTAIRSEAISSRLDDLHEVYGQSVESNEQSMENDDSAQGVQESGENE